MPMGPYLEPRYPTPENYQEKLINSKVTSYFTPKKMLSTLTGVTISGRLVCPIVYHRPPKLTSFGTTGPRKIWNYFHSNALCSRACGVSFFVTGRRWRPVVFDPQHRKVFLTGAEKRKSPVDHAETQAGAQSWSARCVHHRSSQKVREQDQASRAAPPFLWRLAKIFLSCETKNRMSRLTRPQAPRECGRSRLWSSFLAVRAQAVRRATKVHEELPFAESSAASVLRLLTCFVFSGDST